MRKIERIFVHCTAGSQRQTIEDLKREFKRKGWKHAGYHYVVKPDGAITQLEPEDTPSNGVYIKGKAYNSTSINVAYIGGIDAKGKATDNRTNEQRVALRALLKRLKAKYPNAIILGHRDASPDLNKNGKVDSFEWVKMCPCFNAKEEYKDL